MCIVLLCTVFKKNTKKCKHVFFSYIYTSLPSTFNNSDIVLDENRYILNIGFYHSKYVSLENDVNKSVTVCRFSYSAWKDTCIQ